VGRLRFGLYASQSYLERRLRGGKLEVTDLPRHDFIGYEGTLAKLPQAQWTLSRGATRFVFRSNSDLALLEATLQGQGICMLPDAAVRSVPGLVRLDVDADLPSVAVFLAFHRELRSVPRVRLVIDALDALLRDGMR
jgi:DNA-binding transcriptional LysR family regulator